MRKYILLTLLLTFLSTATFAQEAARDKIFILNDFSGGLATQLDETSTPAKFARIVENVRLNSSLHSIVKRSQMYSYGTADATEAITGLHRLYLASGSKVLIAVHGDEIETGNDSTGVFTTVLALTTGDYRWKFLTWHNLAIGGDGYNQPVKYDGTTATYLGTCAAAVSGSAGNPNGTYTYKVSFYTASYEVLFNVASNSVSPSSKQVSLSQIPIGPTTYNGEAIIGRKVYRIESSVYKLLSNGTIANNTATTLTDNDTTASGTTMGAGTATWTPPMGKFYLIHKNRLFIANNPSNPSRIYYSKDGSHDLFDTSLDYFDIRTNDGDEITGIFNLLGKLTICKTNSWQKLYTDGDDPYSDWSISDPFSMIGCDAPYSAVNTPIGILYLSKAKGGLYVFNGQSSTLKSAQITPTITDVTPSNLTNVWGEYNNNVYYMAYPSTSVGGAVNNRVLVYDLITNSFEVDTLKINAFCSLSGGTDGGVLYGGASDSGKVYQFTNTLKEIIHSKHSDFSGTFDDSRYIPIDIGGDPNSPVLELSWDLTIDSMVGAIDALSGDVDRPDGSGTYISPVLDTPGAATYDKFYWNEVLPGGTDVTVAVRGGATAAACAAASFSSEFTSPGGSDISGLTAYPYTQYRLTFSSSDIDYTPNVVTLGGITTKMTYNTLGTAVETSIAIHWQSGWLDFGLPGYKKTLRKLYCQHKGTNGTLTIKFTNEYGDTDTFDINLGTYPEKYEEYFTTGAFVGKNFKIDITNSDMNDLTIKEIECVYDVEPLV